MKCLKCAEEAGSGRFCRSCGAPVAAVAEQAQADAVCPACGAVSRPGAKFCASCAAPLGSAPAAAPVAASTICVHCGAENKAATKFCKSCGKAVSSGLAAVPPRAAVSPDMMPTMIDTAAQVTATVPQPVPSPVMAEPVRAPRPVAVPPRVESPALPKAVAPSEPAARMDPPQPGGSNRTLVIAGVVVLALAAAGAIYKFVLKKPSAETAQTTPAVEAPSNPQSSPAPATPEPAPDAANPENQIPPASTDAQQPADTSSSTAPTSSAPPAGNSAASAAGAVTPSRTPKRSPAKPGGPPYASAHANAEQAFSASQYITPPDSNALSWARKAKALGDPAAAQIEQQVFTKLMSDVAAARQSHLYDQALAQLYQVASNFPDHPELRTMQTDIHQEQQAYTKQIEDQRRQADLAAQIKKFPAQHKHGAGENFCTGAITITPDGTGHYDCNTADSKGRCEHVTFTSDSLKEVKIRGDGSLHVATRQQGNFDFTGGEFAMRDAAGALGKLVKR